MSLRLIKPGLTGIFHPTMRDPRTKLALEAVGVGKRGPIWPVMGGSGEDEEEDEDEDEGSEGEGSEGEGQDDSPEGLKARIKALEDEKDRHYKRRKSAETELEELRKFKKSKDEEGLSDADKATKAAAEAQERSAKQEAELRRLQRERSFLLANEITWHDREDVLKALDWDLVEVSEDGTVDPKSLKAELKRLAKAKPWLVKKSETDDEDEDEDKGKKPSSSTMNGKKKGSKGAAPSREELSKRFPALRQR